MIHLRNYILAGNHIQVTKGKAWVLDRYNHERDVLISPADLFAVRHLLRKFCSTRGSNRNIGARWYCFKHK